MATKFKFVDHRSELAALRERIASLKIKRAELKDALLPQAEAEANVDRYVQRLADEAGIYCRSFAEPGAELRVFASYESHTNPRVGALALACYVTPDAVRARLKESVAEVYADAPLALSPGDAAKQTDAFAKQIFALECEEEALIRAAADAGQDLLRRPDADVLAIVQP